MMKLFMRAAMSVAVIIVGATGADAVAIKRSVSIEGTLSGFTAYGPQGQEFADLFGYSRGDTAEFSFLIEFDPVHWNRDNYGSSTLTVDGLTSNSIGGASFFYDEASIYSHVYVVPNSYQLTFFAFTDNIFNGPVTSASIGYSSMDMTSGAFSGFSFNELKNVSYRFVMDPVPEPGTWMTMLAGFGATGAAMRRKRRLSTTIAQA
jgi:hypothetical protein